MKIYIGSDHRGFELKEKIIKVLKKWGDELVDMGAHHYDQKDDYTLYAEKVALMVKDNLGSFGILLCGSGVGVDVVANKFDGIRASIGKNPKQVKAGRSDDDMNILVIPSDYTSEDEAKELVRAFLGTEFKGNVRYKKRLEEIKRIEENN
jgi:ribose 5-phosphate isomerase B